MSVLRLSATLILAVVVGSCATQSPEQRFQIVTQSQTSRNETQLESLAAYDPARRCFGRRGTSFVETEGERFMREEVRASLYDLVSRFSIQQGDSSRAIQGQTTFVRHDACTEHRPLGAGRRRLACDRDLAVDLQLNCALVARDRGDGRRSNERCKRASRFLVLPVRTIGRWIDNWGQSRWGHAETAVNCDALPEYGSPRPARVIVGGARASGALYGLYTEAAGVTLVDLNRPAEARQIAHFDARTVPVYNMQGLPWRIAEASDRDATLGDLGFANSDLSIFPPILADLDGSGEPEIVFLLRRPRPREGKENNPRVRPFVGPVLLRYVLETGHISARLISPHCPLHGLGKECATPDGPEPYRVAGGRLSPYSTDLATIGYDWAPMAIRLNSGPSSSPDLAGARDALIWIGPAVYNTSSPPELGIYWARVVQWLDPTNAPEAPISIERHAVARHENPSSYRPLAGHSETYRRLAYPPIAVRGDDGADKVGLLYRDAAGFFDRGYIDLLSFNSDQVGNQLAFAKRTAKIEEPQQLYDGAHPGVPSQLGADHSRLTLQRRDQLELTDWSLADFPLTPLPSDAGGAQRFIAISLANCDGNDATRRNETDCLHNAPEFFRVLVQAISPKPHARLYQLRRCLASDARGCAQQPPRKFGSVLGDFLRYPAFAGRYGPRGASGMLLVMPTTAEERGDNIELPRRLNDRVSAVRLLRIYEHGDTLAADEWSCGAVPEKWRSELRLARAAWVTGRAASDGYSSVQAISHGPTGFDSIAITWAADRPLLGGMACQRVEEAAWIAEAPADPGHTSSHQP
jgi:hypothetical protein